MTTEEIFWLAIKDIENGNAKTLEEDPINGFLTGNNKKLTKKNVCDQTAKYNNGKAFSRPTLDSYIEVANYISKTKPFNNITLLKEKDKKSTQRIEELNQIISQLQEEKKNLAFENYQLQEKIKFLENN
tara:strand:- start:18224 stop:18610 length:387 start_codon:yes stop_codon:yes gene_type:complete